MDARILYALHYALYRGFVRERDNVIVVSGFGVGSGTNTVRVTRVAAENLADLV